MTQMFILDMLDNMPRLRLSTDHLKLFIWALNELGVPDVPSLKRFRDMQDRLTKVTNVRTTLKKSPQGEPFYQNSVPDLLGLVRDMATLTRGDSLTEAHTC